MVVSKMKLKRGGLVIAMIFIALAFNVSSFTGDDGLYTTLFISTISHLAANNGTDASGNYNVQIDMDFKPTGYGKSSDNKTEVYLGYIHVANIDYYPNISGVIAVAPILDLILDNDSYLQAGDNFTVNATIIDETPPEYLSVWIRFWQELTTLYEGLMNFISGNLWQINITTNSSWIGDVNYTITVNDTFNGVNKTSQVNSSIIVDDLMFDNVTLLNQTIEPSKTLYVNGTLLAAVTAISGNTYNVYFDGVLNQTNAFDGLKNFNFTIPMPSVNGNYSLIINTTIKKLYEEYSTWVYVTNIPYITNLNFTPQPSYTSTTIIASWDFNDIDIDEENITYFEWFVNNNSVLNGSTVIRGASTVLTSSNFAKGDIVSIKVTPSDTHLNGTPKYYSFGINNLPPTITSMTLNTPTSEENLTVSYLFNDVDNDADSSVIDWRKNSLSLALINMPFEYNNLIYENGVIKDYSSNSLNGKIYGDTKLLLTFDTDETDNTAYQNPVTNNGATHKTNGCVSAGCYEFDGNASYIDMPFNSNLNISEKITVSAWVKRNTEDLSDNYDIIIEKKDTAFAYGGTEWSLQFDGAGNNLNFQVNNESQSYVGAYTTTDIVKGRWYNIIGTYDGNFVRIYTNGVLEDSVSLSGRIFDLGGNITIGAFTKNDSTIIDYFNGSIDEVAIYDRALNSSEVLDLYQSGKAKFIEFSNAKVGKGVYLDGVDDYIYNNNTGILNNNSEFSFTTWFKSDLVTTNNTIIHKFGGFAVNIIDSSNISFNIVTKNASGAGCGNQFGYYNSSSTDLSEYHFISGTNKNGTINFYFDGALFHSFNSSCNLLAFTSTSKLVSRLSIGHSYDGNSNQRYFNGYIDEVKLYNISLTDEQIKAEYEAGLASHSNNIIVSSETLKGENWTAYITSNDAEDDGEEQSETVTIQNAAPKLTAINISPSIFGINQNVSITSISAFDNDGDSYRLECGMSPGASDLCNSTYGYNEQSCTFNNTYWFDDSLHTIYCSINDSFNISNEVSDVGLTDNTLPTITLISPIPDYSESNSYSIDFIFQVNDANNILNCSLYIDNVLNLTASSPSKLANIHLNKTFSVGTYEWKIGCFDEAHNFNFSEVRNVTIIPEEKVTINSLGVIGVEGSENITTYRNVLLVFNLIDTSNMCRYKNEFESWSIWEECTSSKPWQLTTGYGLKNISVEINHSGFEEGLIILINDEITYSQTGAGSGTTLPSSFNVYDSGDYTNSNNISFYWTDASDEQTNKLGLGINYSYILEDSTNNTNFSSWIDVGVRELTLNYSLVENHSYKLYVKAVNPSGKEKIAISNGIITDFTNPSILVSSNHPINIWTNNNSINYNWSATDLNGIKGYSIVLDENQATIPDNIVDTANNNKSYSLVEGNYYLHIKSIDNALNSNTTHYGPFKLDTTPPSTPYLNNPNMYTSTIYNVSWTKSTDNLSGIDYYSISIFGPENITQNGTNISNLYESFLISIPGNYYAVISVFDLAGNNISTSDINITPLEITFSSPNSESNTTLDTRIIIKTNKKATCSNDFNGKFKFTDSTYHETKITYPTGLKSLIVTCTDYNGYRVSKTLSFNVVSTTSGAITITNPGVQYENQEIKINISVGTLAGIEQNEIKLTVNGTHLDFSLIDLSGGNYELTTKLLAGTYDLKITHESNTNTLMDLIVLPLRLTVEYVSAISSPVQKSNMVYSDNNEKLGIASESKLSVLTSSSSKLSLKTNTQNYLFMTNNNIKKTNDLLKDEAFLKQTNGFGISKLDYLLRQIISHDRVVFDGTKIFTKGMHNIIIINKGKVGNQSIISIKEIE